MSFNTLLTFFLILNSTIFADTSEKVETESKSKPKSEKVLKELSSTTFVSFDETIKDKTLAVLFQPNCSSCRKQIKNLECLKQITNKIILIGSLGTEKKVQRSYLKKKSNFKGYFVEQENLEKLGFESDIAPQTIYYSTEKGLKFIGYKSCKKIKKKIEALYAGS